MLYGHKSGSKGKGGKGSKKDSEKDPLEASIETRDVDGDYPDISGWVSVEYNDNDKLVIDYSIRDGPERCKKCLLAIYSGDACDDLDSKYHDLDENPWKVDEGTVYITNKKGRAAGYFKTENGYKYSKNECKYIVLFDEDKDRRRLEQNSSQSGGRNLKKGKKPSGPKKIACGQLIPEDKDKDYC